MNGEIISAGIFIAVLLITLSLIKVRREDYVLITYRLGNGVLRVGKFMFTPNNSTEHIMLNAVKEIVCGDGTAEIVSIKVIDYSYKITKIGW